MRKTSAYARKRKQTPVCTFNAAAFLNSIERCRPYSERDDFMESFGGSHAASAALRAELLVRDAASSLITHQRPENPEHAFDVLAHALGVSIIRALQIQPDEASNPALPPLQQGTLAVQRSIKRYRDTNAWGMDAKGKEDLAVAIEIYAEILQASSPVQMAKATEERQKILLRVSDKLTQEIRQEQTA